MILNMRIVGRRRLRPLWISPAAPARSVLKSCRLYGGCGPALGGCYAGDVRAAEAGSTLRTVPCSGSVPGTVPVTLVPVPTTMIKTSHYESNSNILDAAT
jgi:hypothetical protein